MTPRLRPVEPGASGIRLARSWRAALPYCPVMAAMLRGHAKATNAKTRKNLNLLSVLGGSSSPAAFALAFESSHTLTKYTSWSST